MLVRFNRVTSVNINDPQLQAQLRFLQAGMQKLRLDLEVDGSFRIPQSARYLLQETVDMLEAKAGADVQTFVSLDLLESLIAKGAKIKKRAKARSQDLTSVAVLANALLGEKTRFEHATPISVVVRALMEVADDLELLAQRLVETFAVARISLAEDARINAKFRSTMPAGPVERAAECGVVLVPLRDHIHRLI